MIIEVHPWKLDVDIEGTKNFYKDNDYSLNKEWNRNFVNGLNKCQKEFFENLGIDLMNIEIEKHDFEENPEVPFIYSVNFLFCGKFLSMPEEQIEMYREEEIYGSCFEIESVESVPCKALSVYDGLGLGIGMRFKYPFSHFEDSRFEKWDCGFINGAVIVRGLSIDDDLETE